MLYRLKPEPKRETAIIHLPFFVPNRECMWRQHFVQMSEVVKLLLVVQHLENASLKKMRIP
jgi:hypothetical protein